MNKFERHPFLSLAVLACMILGVGLGCGFSARESETATPTRVVALPATATATATPLPPTATATLTPAPSATPTTAMTTEVPDNTPAPSMDVILQDPSPEEMTDMAYNLAPGTRFTLILTEQYVTDMARTYINEVEDLPIAVQDVTVDFTSEQVLVSAKVPLGFFNVEVVAAGLWRAAACAFEAEVIDVTIAGQSAPASLREQIDPALDSALQASQNLAACFTAVELSDDRVTVRGYRE